MVVQDLRDEGERRHSLWAHQQAHRGPCGLVGGDVHESL